MTSKSKTPRRNAPAAGALKKTKAASAASKRRVSKKVATAKSGAPHVGSFGIAPYKPKKNEEYMSDGQLEHFRSILERWKESLMEEVDRTIDHLRDDSGNFPDANDRASMETEFGIELKTRDRERKLVRKINAALERITQGTYGYCEKTGEEIGLARLEARPIATMCLEAQERYETIERHFGD